MSVVDTFSVIKDICLSVAACGTAYVAYTGLEKWKEELRGKANFEVARTLIRTVYKLRDELKYCRSPFVPIHEFPESYRNKGLGKTTQEEEGEAWVHVYSNRWKPVGLTIQDFDSALLEAEALWGADIKEKGQALRQCARYLQVAIDAVISNAYSGGEDFKDKEFGKSMRARVSESSSEDNELSQKISTAIEELESEIRPHLSRS